MLTTQANPGDRTLQVQSIAGLLAGDQITLGQGTAAETAKIKHVGTATAEMPLSQDASAGSRVVHVTPPDTTTGVPGSAQQAAQLVAGEHVTIGSGADADHDVIAKVGTFDMVNPSSVPYEGNPTADWIWNTPGSANSAAAGTIYLRKTFTTPAGMTRARLRINADDAEVTYVNGQQVASSTYPNWPTSETPDITKDLNPAGQTNVIAIAATNNSPGPGGVIAAIGIDGSSPQRIVTDSSWKAWPAPSANPPTSPNPPAANWNTVGFDDSSWSDAASAGAYGVGPWGTQADGGSTEPSSLVAQPGGSSTIAAPAGATNVEVADTNGFLRGDTITIGSGTTAESRTITSVGVSGSGTTLSSSAASGDLQLTVASSGGLTAGQYITVGQGSAQETDRIATIDGNTLTLYTPLKGAHASGDAVAVKSIGVTFAPALSHSHDVGEAAVDTGTGITLRNPLTHDHASGEEIASPGTGVTLTAPLKHAHMAGANDAVTTGLSTATAANATNIKLDSVAGLASGDRIAIGQPGHVETGTIHTVGTAGAGGTGVTVSPALSRPHDAGDQVVDATNASVTNPSGGVSDIERESLISAELVQCLAPSVADSETNATTSLSAGATSGATSITVAGVANVSVGDRVTVGTGAAAETRAVTAITGQTLTLNSALTGSHASGDPVWDTCTTAPTGGTRELDPSTARDVTGEVKANRLNFTPGTLHDAGGPLPAGNGQPWELFDFYMQGDTQTNSGGTATTPNQWLGHLSVASGEGDDRILRRRYPQRPGDPVPRSTIRTSTTARRPCSRTRSRTQTTSTGCPTMIADWRQRPRATTRPAAAGALGTGRNANGRRVRLPASDTDARRDARLAGARRLRQMWNYRYIHDYVRHAWTAGRARTGWFRCQSYGDPIDDGEAAANVRIPEGEHLEFAGRRRDPAVQGDRVRHLPGPPAALPLRRVLRGQLPVRVGRPVRDRRHRQGRLARRDRTATRISDYLDQAGGVTQIIYHGWPYTVGSPGSPAIWPGNTYGGDTASPRATAPTSRSSPTTATTTSTSRAAT